MPADPASNEWPSREGRNYSIVPVESDVLYHCTTVVLGSSNYSVYPVQVGAGAGGKVHGYFQRIFIFRVSLQPTPGRREEGVGLRARKDSAAIHLLSSLGGKQIEDYYRAHGGLR